MKNKKALAAAILAAVTLGVSAPAFAAHSDASVATAAPVAVVAPADLGDVAWSGEIRLRADMKENVSDDSSYRIRLVAKTTVAENLTAKIRFAVAKTIAAGANDDAKMDQASLTYSFNDAVSSVTIGKDDVWMGNGLLMDNFFESIQAKTSIESVDLTVFAGRKDDASDLSGISAQTKIGSVGIGASFLKTEGEDATAINASYSFDNVALSAELANWDISKNEFLGTATIGEAAKKGDTNYVVSYYKTNGANADTTLDVIDSRGYIVGVNHMLADTVTFTVEHHFNDNVDMTRAQILAKF